MIALSVIIPLANNDDPTLLVQELLSTLRNSQIRFEIFVVTSPDTKFESKEKEVETLTASKKSRAAQLNLGASLAKGELLWFLHADSCIAESQIPEVIPTALEEKQATCWYFKLKFQEPHSKFSHFNAHGANFRSKAFQLPFGDQGLLLRREVFRSFGLYPEKFYSAEDHAFIQVLKKNKIEIKCTNTSIATSARKYEKHGWAKTTLNHLYLMVLQEYKFHSND